MLLSLAIMPLIATKFWHKYEVLTLFIVALVSAISTYLIIENPAPIYNDAIVNDYIPFIIMLLTLYILSNGINIKLNTKSTTLNNIVFLGISSLFASMIGTTGASMLLLRPFIQMNKDRENKAHLIIFFIFLVSNIGGILTPLGDPPLLIGYLHGVNFLWCIKNLFGSWIFYVSSCLAILAIIDHIILKRENPSIEKNSKFSLKITGMLNIFLIISTVFILFIDTQYNLYIFDIKIPQVFIKNVIFLLFCFISLKNNRDNKIDFSAFKEVAITFFVIFIVIAPVLFVLNENTENIHNFMTTYISGSDNNCSAEYFWMCGIASSFLDNAPSYLLFFNMAGGNAHDLMYVHTSILKAISIGAVMMGSITYIGNAPNMMVRSIAIKNNIKMPSFVGYMKWSLLIILPLSIIMSFLL